MTVKQFNRDTAYFQIMRDRGMMINSEDLDLQFNNLADYLNKKITPLVNSLVAKEIPGVADPNLANAALLNVGDGSTQWIDINTNSLNNFTVPLSKFAIDNPDFLGIKIGSIIASDNNKVFSSVTSLEADDVLLSRINNAPIWRKIETGDIQDGSITSTKLDLQSVGLEHLSLNLVGIDLTPNSILNNFILNGNITGDKLQDGAITGEKISNDLLVERQRSIDNRNYTILDLSLENRHFADGVIIGNTNNGEGNYYLGRQMKCIQKRLTNNLDDNVNYTFTPDNIIDNSLTESVLRAYIATARQFLGVNRIEPKTHFANGAIESRHIQDHLVSLRNKSPFEVGSNARIGKQKLDPIIRQKLGLSD